MDSAAIIDRYYNLSLRYLSYRPRSEKEVFDYLMLKTKNLKLENIEELVGRIITKLKKVKFLVDREFARFWVELRTKF